MGPRTWEICEEHGIDPLDELEIFYKVVEEHQIQVKPSAVARDVLRLIQECRSLRDAQWRL